MPEVAALYGKESRSNGYHRLLAMQCRSQNPAIQIEKPEPFWLCKPHLAAGVLSLVFSSHFRLLSSALSLPISLSVFHPIVPRYYFIRDRDRTVGCLRPAPQVVSQTSFSSQTAKSQSISSASRVTDISTKRCAVQTSCVRLWWYNDAS